MLKYHFSMFDLHWQIHLNYNSFMYIFYSIVNIINYKYYDKLF